MSLSIEMLNKQRYERCCQCKWFDYINGECDHCGYGYPYIDQNGKQPHEIADCDIFVEGIPHTSKMMLIPFSTPANKVLTPIMSDCGKYSTIGVQCKEVQDITLQEIMKLRESKLYTASNFLEIRVTGLWQSTIGQDFISYYESTNKDKFKDNPTVFLVEYMVSIRKEKAYVPSIPHP